MSNTQVTEIAEKISVLMTERLGLKGASLEGQLHRSGRRMPRKIKRKAEKIAAAALMADHPKVSQQIDVQSFDRDAHDVVEYLQGIDPTQEKITKVLQVLAKFAAVLIIGAAVAIWIAYERGAI